MLRKPSNPSPYNSVVDKPTEDKLLTFTASCVGASDIKGMRLSIKDDVHEYYLPVKNSDSCKTNSSITIPFDADTLDEATGFYIKTSNFTRTDGGITLNNIIKPLNRYRWQVRLYQDDPDINIAYGFVQDVYTYNSSGADAFKRRKILKVRPHTNMFMGDSQALKDKKNIFVDRTDDEKTHIRNNDWTKCKQLTEYYDNTIKYQIQFNGVVYDVKDYYYSKTNAYYDIAKKKYVDLTAEKQFNEPLYGYIEIDINDGDTIEEGAEYTILTNYIDSNEYNFSCRELSEVTFKGRDDKPISEFTSIDELDANPDNHIYKPAFSNVKIKGSFPTTSTSTINYYHATLYQVLSNGEDIQIHDSGYMYNSEIDYDCKDLLSGSTYKLVISVTDTYGNTTSKGVYIQPDCGAIVKPTLLSVEPYREHGSVVLDFGKLLSITGVEADGYNGGYTIHDLDATWADGLNYTGFTLSSVGETERIHSKACEIASGNTVTWSKYDGVNKHMTCTSPVISTTFCCTGGLDKQTIFELTVGIYTYRLTWEAYRFHLWIGRTYTIPISKVITEVDENFRVITRTITERVTQNQTVRDSYYTPYESTGMDAVHTAMTKSDLDYSVPYLMYEDMPMEDTLYMHTESVASDCWWHVIVSDGYWYMKCIYAPVELSLEHEENYVIPYPHNTEATTSLTLYGGCTYCNVLVDEYNSSSYSGIEKLKVNPLKDLVWDDNTVFQINFYKDLSGGNFDGGFAANQYADVDHFRIYKKYSDQPQLHKVYETTGARETIIEDFTVGCKCPYTYYIVPVCKDSTTGAETIGSIMQSNPIELNDGTIRVIGLIQDDDDLDTYYIDMNNVWNFSLNVNNTGFQSNMGKTYNDTPQKYPVEVKNKGFYRTFNIRGLLGRFDCGTMKYVDTYDDIIEWENFVDNGEMKLVIDLRGIQTIGTMENNSVDYDENGANLVYANFSIKQLEDIDNITILNRKLLFNPASGEALLMDVDGLALQDSDNKYLIVNNGK